MQRFHGTRGWARRQRRGNSFLLVLGLLVALAAVGGTVYWTMFRGPSEVAVGPILHQVASGPFDYMVLEQGEVESSSSLELRCEVRSRGAGGGGITILKVLPEGTPVKKGDVLVELDSSALKQEQTQQQIAVNTSLALVIQAKKNLEAAEIALQEYTQGTFVQEQKVILGEKFVAEQNVRSAELSLDSSKRLAAKGIITPLQLEGAEFAKQKADNELDAALNKLKVLENLTKKKMETQLGSDVEIAKAKVAAEESSYRLEENKLKDIDEQVAKCTIIAPQDGQVVYANKFSQGRSGANAEFVVEAGSQVREQQPIIKLPNSKDMQVKALVNEARITLVRPGQPVTIRVDALKDQLIQGEVMKVNQYAEPGGWAGGNVKKYATFILIKNPPKDLRSGMNAEVRIHIERRQDALQLPVQALAEHRGHYFVLAKNGESYETREVTIASTNDKTAVVESGVKANDQVVMNPRAAKWLKLPDLKEPSLVKDVQLVKADGAGPDVKSAVTPDKAGGSGPGGPGGEPRKGGKGPGGPGGGNWTPPTAAQIVTRAFEADADKDDKLSAAEIATMNERSQSSYRDADTNKDGFVDRAEATVVAGNVVKMMRERMSAGGAGGPPGGGPPGGGPPGGGQ